MIGRPDSNRHEDRGQLVLLAAAVLAIALVPVLFAYLQLGYHADVTASTDYDAPGRTAERYVDRAVHEAASGVAANHTWQQRSDAVDTVRRRVDDRLATLATARVESGTAYRTRYNQTAAESWADTQCPDGPDRQFGPCETRRGVVVQDRLGQTHVLAVALDVRVTTERGTRRLTVVETVSP